MPSAEELMTAMRAKAGNLRSLGHRVRIDLSDSDEHIMVSADGRLEACEAEAEADTVFRLSAADLEKLIAGRLSPMLAFTLGKLKVEGSKGVAMKLASLLDED